MVMDVKCLFYAWLVTFVLYNKTTINMLTEAAFTVTDGRRLYKNIALYGLHEYFVLAPNPSKTILKYSQNIAIAWLVGQEYDT